MRQDCDESRPQGGQAPDQASNGRQTGAAAHPDGSFPRHALGGQSLDESQETRRQPGWQRSQTDRLAESHSPLTPSSQERANRADAEWAVDSVRRSVSSELLQNSVAPRAPQPSKTIDGRTRAERLVDRPAPRFVPSRGSRDSGCARKARLASAVCVALPAICDMPGSAHSTLGRTYDRYDQVPSRARDRPLVGCRNRRRRGSPRVAWPR